MGRRYIFVLVTLFAVALRASVSAQTPTPPTPVTQADADNLVARQQISRAMDESIARVDARLDRASSADWFWPSLAVIIVGVLALETGRRWWRQTEWRRALPNDQPEAISQQQPIQPVQLMTLFEKRRS